VGESGQGCGNYSGVERKAFNAEEISIVLVGEQQPWAEAAMMFSFRRVVSAAQQRIASPLQSTEGPPEPLCHSVLCCRDAGPERPARTPTRR
jgi:hypothetical protein